MSVDLIEPRATSTPVPLGRGRWRITLHRRTFAAQSWQSTIITELVDARSRVLTQAWNTPASLAFTLDGSSPNAPLILELATDVICWRWDENAGADVPVFRGIVDHSEDQVTADAATTNFTAHDYLSMLSRRITTVVYARLGLDQDTMVAQLVALASGVTTSSGTSFSPGSWLPLTVAQVNPDGTARGGLSGQLRDRTYYPSQEIGAAISDLAAVIGGFDYDCQPGPTVDRLRLFYSPTGVNQGVTRTDLALQWGSSISALTRTVASDAYANYNRVLGNNGSSDPNAAQLYAEAWNRDANNVTVNPVGLWMAADNAADVNIQTTLNDKAAGDLNLNGILVPSYTVTMRPGAYAWGYPNMGDVVPLYVKVGRLNVNTTARVVGIAYTIGDDGNEDVALTLGRPPRTLAAAFTQADRDVDALTRR